MEVSIILNGKIRNTSWLKKNIRGVVIAADGGANSCRKFNVVPDYIVGDFDSVAKSTLAAFKETSQIIYDASQESTDFEKALQIARSLKPKKISVFGGFGGDLDHQMGNILSLTPECVMQNEEQTALVVQKRLSIRGSIGQFVSVIALSPVEGLSYSGLTWKAPKGKLPAGWLGIRNTFAKGNANIHLKKGRIAVITRTS
jgi:thiamine pyrophosphokinase